MCFARLLVPCRVAMLLPAVESVWMRRFSLLQMLVSSRKFLRCSPSLTPVQMAYSSDSAELSAIVACVLLPNATVVPRKMMLKPEVDFLVVGHPAQSAST